MLKVYSALAWPANRISEQHRLSAPDDITVVTLFPDICKLAWCECFKFNYKGHQVVMTRIHIKTDF